MPIGRVLEQYPPYIQNDPATYEFPVNLNFGSTSAFQLMLRQRGSEVKYPRRTSAHTSVVEMERAT